MTQALGALLLCTSLLLGATQARASAVTMTSDYTGATPHVGLIINIQLHLDATETGIQLLALNLLFDEEIFQYNPQPNAAVGVPTYILYGGSMPMSALFLQQDPWQYWPAPPPGFNQVNVNWADPSFLGTQVTGLGFKIAEIQLELVNLGDGIGEIVLTNTAGGGVYQVNGVADNGALTLNGSPITLIPEPSTVAMVALGVVGLAIVRRSRR